jgi:hypothetical protein
MAWGVVIAFILTATAVSIWHARSRNRSKMSDAQSQVLRDLMNVAYCHKVLLAAPHCGELVRATHEMRSEALSLSRESSNTDVSPAVYGNASVKQTEAGLNVLCTTDERETGFHYHYSISMPEFTPGFHLTAPQGQTLTLLIGRAMGRAYDQMHVQQSAASVFHVEWDVHTSDHTDWLSRTSNPISDAAALEQLRDECFEARHHMQWRFVPGVKELIKIQSTPDTADREWFYSPDGQNRIGPVSLDDLRALVVEGKIGKTTALWREGLEMWVPANAIDGLFNGRET